MRCPGFDGTALVVRVGDDGLRWDHADPGIHVAAELLDSGVLLSRYVVVGECPEAPGIHHARLRECQGQGPGSATMPASQQNRA